MAITTLNSTDSGAVSRTTINDNFTDLDTTKADLASPAFTGSPTAPTQSANDNSTKLATTAYVDSANTAVTIETTTGTTHSLTTTGEKVVVWAKGTITNGAGDNTITLAYNSVTKDTVISAVGTDGDKFPFALQYTETPSSGTQNITVQTSSGSISNVVIIVMKIS